MTIAPPWMDAMLSWHSKQFILKCRWMLNAIFRACCLILFWNQDVKRKYICPWTAALARQLEIVFMGNGRSSGIEVPAVCVFTESSTQRLLRFGEVWLGGALTLHLWWISRKDETGPRAPIWPHMELSSMRRFKNRHKPLADTHRSLHELSSARLLRPRWSIFSLSAAAC